MNKILVCDDDEIILSVVSLRIEKSNLGEVVKAVNGREAKTFLESNNFNLIITDLHMPFHSGLEIVSFVREDLGKKTPIIVLSGEGLENVVLKAFEMGANDFITKPFNPEDLTNKIKSLL